jgi:Xaa-Pro aminopeptidase
MKSDLDHLMSARELDALIVACEDVYSAPRDYLTGGVDITRGFIVKPQGAPPVIIANPMETEEAAKAGLQVYSFYDIGWAQMLEDAEGDRTKAEVVFWGKCLETVGIGAGKVGIYGVGQFNAMLGLVELLKAAYPQYQFVGEMGMTLFDEAYLTKDPDEIERMRIVANKTSAVVEATWNFIGAARLEGDAVIQQNGEPLTIGAVKRFVRRALLDVDLEDTNMIFAQGRDGGFPHSRGESDTPLRAGQAIVFDLFPREIGGGYFHDMTRTWCISYAPDEVQQAYNQVMEAHDIAAEMIRAGQPTKAAQEAVQTYFESLGHPTARSQPDTNVGYVHGLGHGVGLNIHERPSINHLSKDVFQVGNVLTIEPGLYYPERGFGVRIEDTVYIRPDGSLETLTNFHKDLILPLRA